MIKFAIRADKDTAQLMPLFQEEGVETGKGDEVVKCWKIFYGKNDDVLVGGAVLAKKDDVYFVDGVVMAKDFQRIRLGHELMMRVIEETLAQQGTAVYAEAKVPEFFEECGFEKADKGAVPEIFAGSDCQIMKLEIGVMSEELKSGKGTNA